MAYKRTYSKQNQSQQQQNQQPNQEEETEIILDSKKRVTIRKFNNVNLVDIREYYIDSSGEKKPGKKGISLTEESYYKLIEAHNKIQNALDNLNGGVSSKPKSIEPPTKKVKTDNNNNEKSKENKKKQENDNDNNEEEDEEINLNDDDFDEVVNENTKDTKDEEEVSEEED
ncbi:hypothetical protein KGF54_001928 [Candida jiufengensis]|uniref:uncharacterized protein n=1 Tax=Candida jiufengensis TaxID=497108 RepID=UPI0022257176|nr:uncharacterized protein KGF54_001928 [Candida jiufengensis]KAI5955367.1 hypothetical protein KGF54_001928 [Candida jiufengensis]